MKIIESSRERHAYDIQYEGASAEDSVCHCLQLFIWKNRSYGRKSGVTKRGKCTECWTT